MSAASLIVVCPVLPYPAVDGGRKRTLRLLEAAAAAGLVPHVLTSDTGDGSEALRDRGWTVEVLPNAPTSLASRARQHLKREPTTMNPAIRERLAALATRGGTVVQLEHTQSAPYGEVLGDVPWVLSLHNVDSELARRIATTERPGTVAWLRAWNQWQSTRAVERREVRRAPGVLCVSDRDRDILAGSESRLVVAPNGVDDEFFEVSPANSAGPTALFFGRLDYAPNRHGLTRFIEEGWPAVVEALPTARLRIVGSGAPEDLETLARAAPGVEFLGYVEDLLVELATCRLTVVPLWAGSGTRLKVLESLAAGRPVVGTALGFEGLSFESRKHGMVAETPTELAAATLALLKRPDVAAELGAMGRELVEEYRWSQTTRPALELYWDLVEAPK